ncbi:MAG: dUTP diphosphatase [Candidatus Neomarinimicrobiota bacterium]|nr:dUTP diphosphatase [Candidatus Neomarinimicrobiota bacterium]
MFFAIDLMHLKITALSKSAQDLYKNHGHFHQGDAGLDLFIIDALTIAPGETALIKSHIACENTDGMPYLLMPRSSISKTPLRQCNSIGLIDAGYRGEIMAAVDNIKEIPFTIEPGQRLFQLVSMDGGPISFEIVSELSTTDRGQGGFGSTGK